eukprot:6125914-Pyramimonas_sp.AAC.1
MMHQMLSYLTEGAWLDERTFRLDCSVVFYNGAADAFTLVRFNFKRQPGGAIVWTREINSVDVNMYDSAFDRARAFCE